MIGKNIRELRKANHETQSQLAEALGVSQKTIAAWECNTREPTIAAVTTMKQHFSCSYDDLLQGA
jgi:transcriptional regulator with XRE-family HTH domain